MRKALPKKLEKEVYQQFGSQCPFCGESDVTTLQVHHIIPHAKVQEHHIQNLLLTCANCHQKIENEVIAPRDVHAAKFQAEQDADKSHLPKRTGGENVLSFKGTNTGIVANTVKIEPKSGSPINGPIAGTIGADMERRNYTKYLIDRYHQFKQHEVGKNGMKHAVFYASIKRKFGAKWDHIPVQTFGKLVSFLQSRIDGTSLGKTRKARHQKNYSTFEEHCAKSR